MCLLPAAKGLFVPAWTGVVAGREMTSLDRHYLVSYLEIQIIPLVDKREIMYTLKVTVERIEGYCNQPMLVGDWFLVEGGKIRIPEQKHICMWALQSMMPIFPLLQRAEPKKGDWTSKGQQTFVCPDPKGKVYYRIERVEEEE
ncbi:MAG: hypothetical protein DRG63_06100 [Deltaproteobacteria bacterium]|nr:MAG: hypothetical protein DRG63_06100 [Deltaproteobacteria bacterium]